MKTFFLTHKLCWDIYLLNRPHSDLTSSPASHDQTAKSSKFKRQIYITSFSVLHNNALQALKETPEVCEKNIFQHNQLPSLPYSFIQNLFSSINSLTLMNWLWFFNQHPVISSVRLKTVSDIFHKHQRTDAEKFKNEFINVFIQTDFDISSAKEISMNHTL